jgi:23S rRNA pseudouridine1911/1915/1917 synthase
VEPKIIFEDEEILVLEKPAGMVVNRAETTKGEETVQDWVGRKLKIKDFYGRGGIVHRLDKETSGLLMVAKTLKAFENLQRQFKERKVKKKYLALVHGRVEPSSGVIEASISRSPYDRKKFGVFLGGREARTRYKVIEVGKWEVGSPRGLAPRGSESGSGDEKWGKKKSKPLTFLELTPETGRTHQIRVHLKYIGHPLVGDEKYAGRKTAREDRQWCPRQFLHASELSFTHPKTGKKVEFFSKLPSDLRTVMIKL